MKTWTTMLALALAIGGATLATPEAAEAQQTRTIRCESQNGALQNCRIPNLDQTSVRLTQRLSQSECINGRSWGTQPGLIWVESGCRAEFQYRTTGGGMPSGGRSQITCQSRNDGELQACRVEGLVENSVRLVERLSQAQCINGRTWGTQPNEIWVESGCRAVFEYETTRGGVSEANNPGRRMEITCESRNNARQECYIANLDLGSVQLERNLSQTPCNLDQTFGASRNREGARFFIWVDRGCRGVFSYRVNR